MPTLYDIYQKQGKALPTSVDARFADPQFAAAAQHAGVSKEQYKVNAGNAAMNTRIANAFRSPATTPFQETRQTPQSQQNALEPVSVLQTQSYTPVIQNDPEMNAYYAQQKSLYNQEIDEDAIKQQKLREVESNINALRQVYAAKLNESKRQGRNRLGQASAIQARSGAAGSDFASAQDNEIGMYNSELEGSIRAEEQAAIDAVRTGAEDRASALIREKRAAKEAGAEKYIQFLKDTQIRKQEGKNNLVADLILKNIDPRKLDSNSMQAILGGYGVSKEELFSLYDTEKTKSDNATRAAQAEAEAKQNQQDFENSIKQAGVDLNRAKFEQDKRQFGMDYALRAAKQKSESTGALGGAVNIQKTQEQLNFMNTILDKAESLKSAAGKGGIARTVQGAISGDNDFNRLSKTLDSVKTNVLTLMSDPSVKKFFGPQMTNNDVQLMMSVGTTLDPIANSPQDIQDEITRIRELINRANTAVSQGSNSQDTFAPKQVSEMTDQELEVLANPKK